ncbi:MAG TPA: TonB family protein [Longimicrobium sp.]
MKKLLPVQGRSGVRRIAVALAALLAWTAPAAAQGSAAPADSARELVAVEEQPALLNRREVVREIRRNYPWALWQAKVSGTVTLRFRVTAAGLPDSASVQVMSATHEGFGAAGVASALAMRFSPARLNGHAVPVWVMLPISFIYDPRASPPRPRG